MVSDAKTSHALVGSDSARHDDAVARHLKRVHQWQKVHIAFFMGAFLCSLAGILAFGLVLKNFEVYCPLFANVSVRVDVDGGNGSSHPLPPRYEVDHEASVWGAKTACEFCLFTTVSSFIYAFLWLWLFCSFSRRVEEMAIERLGSAWFRTVPPAVFATCVFSMLVLSCAVLITVGQASVCNSLERQIPAVRCGDAQDLAWKPGVIKMTNFHTLLARSELSIWLAATCWSLNSVLLCCRCILHPEVGTMDSPYGPQSDGPQTNRGIVQQS